MIRILQMKLKLVILFTIGLIFQSFSQDKNLSKLELFYNQENYDIAVRYSQKLITKKGYNENPIPYLFKALALTRMTEEKWYIPKKYRPVGSNIAEALKTFRALDEKQFYARQYSKYINTTHDTTKEVDPNNETTISIVRTKKNDRKKAKNEKNVSIKTSKRDEVVNYSKIYLGTPYKYGGTTKSGFDCSGFSCHVLKEAGVTLPRTSRDQANFAQKINLKDAKKGDLLFFGKSNSSIHHVGVVISEKNDPLTMIHSSTSSGIMITTIDNSDYWKRILQYAGRVIND